MSGVTQPLTAAPVMALADAHLRCLSCWRRRSVEWAFACSNCGGQLVLEHPIDLMLDAGLQAGNTPLHPVEIGPSRRLWLKEEGRNPTGSFKDRAMGAAVAAARRLGARGVCVYSCGNGGVAAAAAAARLGLRCLVLTLPSVSRQAASVIRAYGAELVPLAVEHNALWTSGLVGALQEGLWQRGGWFPLNRIALPLRACPFYLAGCATLAGELTVQLSVSPGTVVVPAGSGDLLLGLWQAFLDRATDAMPLQAPGATHRDQPETEMGTQSSRLASHAPRLVAAEAAGAAPLVHAWERGLSSVATLPYARTIASGIEMVTGSDDALVALRASGGCAASVSDADILAMIHFLARHEGIFVGPEGAAAVAVASRLVDGQMADPIVAVATASGQKYLDLLPAELPAPHALSATVVLQAVGDATSSL